jgi:hypothetical protein
MFENEWVNKSNSVLMDVNHYHNLLKVICIVAYICIYIYIFPRSKLKFSCTFNDIYLFFFKMGDFNVEEEKHLHFCELPDDLIEEILAWLPVEYLGRFATICKQWNSLFSSTRFITNQWALAPPKKKPWLLVGDVEDSRGYFYAYSSFTLNWKMLMFIPFLPFLSRGRRSI